MQPFRLFDLPRELRNLIYEHAIKKRLYVPGGYDANDSQIFLQDAPDVSILLAARQLNLEYKEQLADRTTLLILGARSDYWLGFHHPEETLARSIRHCVVYAHVVCLCDFMDEDEKKDFLGPCDAVDILNIYHEDLCSSLLQHLPQLQTLHIRIGLWCAKDAKYERTESGSRDPPQLAHTPEFKDHLRYLSNLPRAKRIEISRCANDSEYDQFCEGRVLPTVATWTPVDGWCSKWK